MLTCIRAVILAAGMRARLHPYSDLVPMRLVGMSRILMLHNAVHQLTVPGIRKAGAVIRNRCEAFTGCCREFLQQELRTASPTRWSLTAIASPNAPTTGSAVELADHGSVTPFGMDPTSPQNGQGSPSGQTNLTSFFADVLPEHRLPALYRAVKSGQRTAYVAQILAPLGGTRNLARSTDRFSRRFKIDSRGDLWSAKELFTLAELILIAPTSISLASGVRR